MQRGYIKLWRKTMDSYLFTNSRALHLWIHLLFEANHQPKEFMFNGLKQTTERGQFITGRKVLSQATSISETHIEFLLNAFMSEGLIRQQKTNKFRLITILKYELYQSDNRQQIDNKKTTNRQQIDTNKNDKNDKNKDIDEVLAHFNIKSRKSLTLTKERVAVVQACLNKGRTVEQIKKAIDNFCQDDWADRQSYMDLIYAIGVRSKIDNFEKWYNAKSKIDPQIYA